MTLSPEALELVQGGLRSLKAGGEDGHFGECYWSYDGGQRCVWGHIIGAAYPGHPLDPRGLVEAVRLGDVGREIDLAYEAMYARTIDAHSMGAYAEAVAYLDQFLVAHTPKRVGDVVEGLA